MKLPMLPVVIAAFLVVCGCHHSVPVVFMRQPAPTSFPEWVEVPSWYAERAPGSEHPTPPPSKSEKNKDAVSRVVVLQFFSNQAVQQFYDGIGGKDKLSNSGTLIVSPRRGKRTITSMVRNPDVVVIGGTMLCQPEGIPCYIQIPETRPGEAEPFFARFDAKADGMGLYRYARYQNVRDQTGCNISPIRRIVFEDEVTLRPGQWYLRVREFDALRYPFAVFLQTWPGPGKSWPGQDLARSGQVEPVAVVSAARRRLE